MPVTISYFAEKNQADLIFQGNLDESLSRDIWAICNNLSSCMRSCTIDLSAVDHLFDSGVAVLRVLYLRLCEHGIEILILSDHPDILGRVPLITRMPLHSSPVRCSGQSVLSRSDEPGLNSV